MPDDIVEQTRETSGFDARSDEAESIQSNLRSIGRGVGICGCALLLFMLAPIACIVGEKMIERRALRREEARRDALAGAPFDAGRQIVAAIEKHVKAYNSPPGRLSNLAPTFMPAVPTPGWGNNEWRYAMTESFYSLGVSQGGFPYLAWGYDSEGGAWQVECYDF